MPVRIAMWSGPRTISTALLRAWGSRPDTVVADEPFYAHYLAATGLDHPGRAEVLRAQPTDWRAVAATLTGPVPGGNSIFYQKHMAHHLLPEMMGPWLDRLRHAFLLREPAAMLTSLQKVLPDPRPEDTGLPQQRALFEHVRERTGAVPPVIDAREVLEDPPGQLAALCERLGVPYDPAMLTWAPGPRATDGVWAKHWYAAVEASTGFAPPREEAAEVPDRLRPVLDACAPHYATLHAYRLTADDGQQTTNN